VVLTNTVYDDLEKVEDQPILVLQTPSQGKAVEFFAHRIEVKVIATDVVPATKWAFL
jgi:hypothetical protein